MVSKKDVVQALFSAGIVVFVKKEVTFVGGGKSHIYINQRNLRSFPKQKAVILSAYLQMMRKIPKPDLLSDVPSGTIPIVSSLSDKAGIPQITPRDKPKDHGLGESIIGSPSPWSLGLSRGVIWGIPALSDKEETIGIVPEGTSESKSGLGIFLIICR